METIPMRGLFLRCLVCLLLCAPSLTGAAGMSGATGRAVLANYTVRDLGTLQGGVTVATAINNRGQIIGYSQVGIDQWAGYIWHAFLWQSGQMRDLGGGQVHGINNRGQVVGSAGTPDSSSHAFLWEGG